MVDVETLHRMERDLIKPAPPPLHPKPTLRRGTSPAVLPHREFIVSLGGELLVRNLALSADCAMKITLISPSSL